MYISIAARPKGGGDTHHANNISHGKIKLSLEKYCENRSTEEREIYMKFS